MLRKHTKNCHVPLVPTSVDLQVILNEVLAKGKTLRVPTKSIHLEHGSVSPLTFRPVAHLRVYSKCSWWLLSSYIGLVSSVRRFFFSIWVFFHDYLQIIGLPGKGEGISLTPHYHFHQLYWVAGWLLQRAHLCIQLAAGLEPWTFGYDKPLNYTPFGLATIKLFYSRKGKITPHSS